MEILSSGQVNVNNLYVGIKSTNMFFVDFGDSDIIDEYGLFEKNNYNFGIEGKKKFDVFTDLSDGKKVLISDDKVLTTDKNVDVEIVGLVRFVDLLKTHFDEIKGSKHFRNCFNLWKYIEKCNELGKESIVNLEENENFFKAITQADEIYYFSFGYPIEAVQYFEELNKPKPLIFELKDNRVVTKTRCRKKR